MLLMHDPDEEGCPSLVGVCLSPSSLQDTVRRGEVLSLRSNSDSKNWELQSSNGKTRTLPGACFMVPPPDAEALEEVDRYTQKSLTIVYSIKLRQQSDN